MNFRSRIFGESFLRDEHEYINTVQMQLAVVGNTLLCVALCDEGFSKVVNCKSDFVRKLIAFPSQSFMR